MPEARLREFEELVLLAVLVAGEEAYGAALQEVPTTPVQTTRVTPQKSELRFSKRLPSGMSFSTHSSAFKSTR